MLVGNGEGGFVPLLTASDEVQTFSVGDTPWHVATADFNEDGRPDLVTANRNANFLSLLKNKTNVDTGSFESFDSSPIGLGTAPEPTIHVDLDGDETPDTVTATRNDEVTVDVPLGVPDRLARGPLTADINGDQHLDVITANRNGEILIRVTHVDGNGKVAFRPPQIVEDATGEPLRVKDVGVLTYGLEMGIEATRLAVLNRSSNQLEIYSIDVNQGIRIQSLIPNEIDREDLEDPARLVIADVNRDGYDDIIVTSARDGTAVIYSQVAPDQFELVSRVAVGAGPWDIHPVGHGTKDYVDILLVNRMSGDLSLLAADEMGDFSEAKRLRSDSLVYDVLRTNDGATVVSHGAPSGITSGDFNSDGLVDVVVTNGVSSHAALLLGKQNGFVDAIPMLLPTPAGQVVSSDFNGDGQLDVASLHETDAQILIFEGDGKGVFKEAQTPGPIDAGNTPVGMVLDGSDILVVNQFGDVLRLKGDGIGHFGQFRRIDETVSLAVSAATDPVAVGIRSSDRVTVLDDPTSLSAPENVHFVDVNADGVQDLIVANSGSTTGEDVLVYLGLVGGGYHSPRSFASDDEPFANAVGINSADLNGDRQPDLVVTNLSSSTVAILMNGGTTNGVW